MEFGRDPNVRWVPVPSPACPASMESGFSASVLTGATKAKNAKIAGKFDGHLRLSEGLNVTSSGEAKGTLSRSYGADAMCSTLRPQVSPLSSPPPTIRYRGIQVENGGKLFGDIQFATEEDEA
eukprot:jgi/Undpi1/12652/HiC_scaffold_6.g02320.m1